MNGLTLPKLISSLKNTMKLIHGGAYRLLLPLIIHPPMIWYQGGVKTVTRVAIMQFLESWRSQIHGKVLDVGVGTWTYPRQILIDVCEYIATDNFEHPNIDVVSDIHHLADVFPPRSFDFVICTDVLEHIPRPWEAIYQLGDMLIPGGILLLTTPFNYYLHGRQHTKDYWRFSADGLRSLLSNEAGFATVTITTIGHPAFPFCHTVVAVKTSGNEI
jgi:SAM-dependent methyltransferase